MDANGNVFVGIKFDQEGELEERNTYTYFPQGKLGKHVLLFAVEDHWTFWNEKDWLWKKWNTMEMMQVNAPEYVYDEKEKHYQGNKAVTRRWFWYLGEMKYDDKRKFDWGVPVLSKNNLKLWSVFFWLIHHQMKWKKWNIILTEKWNQNSD